MTTLPVNVRSSETSPDTATTLICSNRTQRDAVRQNRAAWHAEGRGFESQVGAPGRLHGEGRDAADDNGPIAAE